MIKYRFYNQLLKLLSEKDNKEMMKINQDE